MGIKISAPGLECAIAGSELFRCQTEEEVQDAIAEIEGDLIDILEKYVDKTQDGVCVQASTIGSLEALLEFLYTSKIPVAAVNIGPVHKKDVAKAQKALLSKNKEYATILCFDVKVTPEAQAEADKHGIKIFTAAIIYHLFDSFTEYVEVCRKGRKDELGAKAVFPCILKVSINCCYLTNFCVDGTRCMLQPCEPHRYRSQRDRGSPEGRHPPVRAR
jgi:translation initiation factor 5B